MSLSENELSQEKLKPNAQQTKQDDQTDAAATNDGEYVRNLLSEDVIDFAMELIPEDELKRREEEVMSKMLAEQKNLESQMEQKKDEDDIDELLEEKQETQASEEKDDNVDKEDMHDSSKIIQAAAELEDLSKFENPTFDGKDPFRKNLEDALDTALPGKLTSNLAKAKEVFNNEEQKDRNDPELMPIRVVFMRDGPDGTGRRIYLFWIH